MLNYKHLSFGEIDDIFKKAKQYSNTKIAKSITRKERKSLATKRHISRSKGLQFTEYPLKINNLISIIMYCDYTDLSRDFTMSFRKTHQFQLLTQIKKHNAKYYHMSKILKDTISQFGQYYNDRHDNPGGNGLLSALYGPFYCGMSVVLNLSQFNMFLHSPLSTSMHLEVALKFSGEKGMLLEMNNESGDCRRLRGMDVSWLSRYREEDERYAYICYTSFVYLLALNT